MNEQSFLDLLEHYDLTIDDFKKWRDEMYLQQLWIDGKPFYSMDSINAYLASRLGEVLF